MCIDNKAKCNGIRDCFDNSDEKDCSVPDTCYPNQFFCAYQQKCISDTLRCNGRNDCGDNADELDCQTSVKSCNSNEFLCANEGRCIPDYMICDGRNDCGDYSDERSCGKLKKVYYLLEVLPNIQYSGPRPPTHQEISLRTYPGSQKTKEGFEVVFRCRDEGPGRLPVKWSRSGGRELPPGASDVNGRLEIPNIRVSSFEYMYFKHIYHI